MRRTSTIRSGVASVPRFLGMGVMLGTALSLAACAPAGGGPSSTTPAEASPAAPPSVRSTAGPATESGVAACDLLGGADIQGATGYTVVDRRAGTVLYVYDNGCEWTLDSGQSGGEPAVVVGVVSPGGRAYYDAHVAPYAGDYGQVAVAGLGDAAVEDGKGNIVAVIGDTLVDVTYTDFPVRHEVAETLARRILDTMAP